MKILLPLFFILTTIIQQATAAVGWRNVTYNDAARAGRAVQTYVYYPAATATINAAFSAPVGTSYPLIVVGHGFAMDYDTYKWIADSLVPSGYIVAIVNTETGFSPSHGTYGLDLRFISSILKNESTTNTTSPFYQRLTNKSGITGHSMGGGCTFLAAGGSTEFACATSLAAAETTPSAIAAAATITVPTLVISGTEDCVAPPAGNQNEMYNALTVCRAKAYIIDGNHCDFSQYDFNCTFGESTCNSTPTLSDVIQQRRTMQLLRPWFDFWLKNDCTAWPTFETRLALPAYNNTTFASMKACTPIPQPIITGFATSCIDEIQTYSVAPIAGSTYLWSVIGGTILSGQYTETVVVQWLGSGVNSISCNQTAP